MAICSCAVDDQGRPVDGITSSTLGSDLDQAQQLPGNLIVSTVMANLFERAWENKEVTVLP